VGKKFGVTRERIRQLQNIALSKLRRALGKKERPVDVELPVEA
jgi:RNA polymerase primary sigma factor